MKKINFSLKAKLLMISILPALVISMIITILSVSKVTEGIRQEMQYGLVGQANSVLAAYDQLVDGEYHLEDGKLMKGDFNITDGTDVLDNMVEGTSYEVTVFYGKTRMATTLVSKDTGARIVGTDANADVVEAVINKGGTYSSFNTTINGENYYTYYLPITDDSGAVIGMMFAGMPSNEADEFINSITRSVIGVAAALMLIVVILAIILTMAIIKALKHAELTIDELAQGNLAVQMDPRYLNRSDEIGKMLKALNSFVAKMNDIVSGMHSSSDVLIESGRKLEEMAQVTSKTTEEINSAVGDISKGAVTQAEEIENATMHIVNIGEIIENIVKNVAQLDNTAERMKNSSDESATIIKELSDSNDKTTEAIERIGNQVHATNESVQSIKEAITMIRSIAEETNLLSLNASIEAARAGEHGRGFAVVASEIQQLAEQSNDSSTKIEEIIDALLTESELTVQVMEEVKIIVEQQQRKLEDTKMKFEDVESGINVCKSETEGIQGQTILCDESREKVVDVIQGLSAISEENAASTEETNASMEELNSIIAVMAEAARELMVLSEQLDENLRFFRQ